MKKIFLGILCISSTIMFSQTSEDAVNIGFNDIIGSGRYMGMGGAFMAVGGDLSSIKDNPAAGGLKRKDEWSLSGAMNFNGYQTDANGNTFNDKLNRFSLPDLNYITVNKTKDRYWKNVNVSFGVNRINNLNSSIRMKGARVGQSYLSSLRDQANELKNNNSPLPANSWANLAYQSYLLNLGDKGYISPLESDDQNYEYIEEQTGKVYDISIAVSASYKQKLYIGGSVSFPVLNAESYSRLSESYMNAKTDWEIDSATTTAVKSAHFETKHSITGSGINAKFGLIYKIDKNFRIGFSVHTPTYYNVEDIFSYKATGRFEDVTLNPTIYEGATFFDLVIPAKYNLGFAYVFGKKGLISMDYSFRDFSGTKYVVPNHDVNYEYFNGSSLDQSDGVNDHLSSLYGASHTFKVGGELNLKPFRIRGGYVNQTSPYSKVDNLKSVTYTGGVGFSKKEFSCDLGYAFTTSESSIDLSPYRNTDKGLGKVENTIHQIVLTFGYKIR